MKNIAKKMIYVLLVAAILGSFCKVALQFLGLVLFSSGLVKLASSFFNWTFVMVAIVGLACWLYSYQDDKED
ncbi:hypothetical protein ACVRXF_09225 [Streptococcus orisasini]